MAVYRPGKGFSKGSLARLRERKCRDAGIADVPAEDNNDQWDKVLGGGGQKKKLRCGSCTRPLTDQEIIEKLLICARCRFTDTQTPLMEIDENEHALAIMYYCQRVALPMTSGQPPLANASDVCSTLLDDHVVGKQCRKSKNGSNDLEACCARAEDDRSRSKARPVAEDKNGNTFASDTKNAKNRAAPAGKQANPKVAVLARGAAIRASSLLKSVHTGHTPLALLSFNLLADCYVRVEGQPWNAFAYCEDAHLAWENRLPAVLQLLRASAADVICLQEVVAEKRPRAGGGPEEWQLPAWTDELRGYTGVLQGLKQKDWEKTAERNRKHTGHCAPTGVATFYSTERFEECAASKHGAGSGSTLFLRSLDASEPGCAPLEFAVANVHLAGDPSKFAEHVKALNSLRQNMLKHEVRIICGDFNGECPLGGEVADWFAQEGYAEVPTGTSWAEPGVAQRLDHIFVSRCFNVIAASGDLTSAEVAVGLPCASCPSDHAPVTAFLSAAAPRVPTRCPW